MKLFEIKMIGNSINDLMNPFRYKWPDSAWLETNQTLAFGPIPGVQTETDLVEVQRVSVLMSNVQNPWHEEISSRFNSIKMLKRVTVLLLHKFTKGMTPRTCNSVYLSVEELDNATKCWITQA